MTDIQRGDLVGLFFEYGPESCIYLGLAEHIGVEKAPRTGLAFAGKFDGEHVNMMSRGAGGVGPIDQYAFRLLETEEVIYEQEVWYVNQGKVQKLLDGCKEIFDGSIEAIRLESTKEQERKATLPLVADGFIEVLISLRGHPVSMPPATEPSPCIDTDDDWDDDDHVYDHVTGAILSALRGAGFNDDGIEMKVRQLEARRAEGRDDAADR